MEQAVRFVLKFDTGAASHVGKIRSVNEDSFVALPESGLWAVADGLGGHEAGEVASQMLTGALATIGRPVSLDDQIARFKDRVAQTNHRIVQGMRDKDGAMGTTVAALLIHDFKFACAWAGDSRVYRIRNMQIDRLSHDHSEVQEMIDQGSISVEEAKIWPRRNVITRAVGISNLLEIEIAQGNVEHGDTFLICSDGLTSHVDEAEFISLAANRRAQETCDRLIDLTLQRGATDNVSVITVRCHLGERTNVPIAPDFRDRD